MQENQRSWLSVFAQTAPAKIAFMQQIYMVFVAFWFDL
jgi:hypothetical protein